MKNNLIPINVSSSRLLNIEKVLERGKREVLEWFNHSNLDPKITVYVYENETKLREGIKKRTNKVIPLSNISYTILENNPKNISRSINIIEQPVSMSIKEYNRILFSELAIYLIDYLYPTLPNWVINGLVNNIDSHYKSINRDYLVLRVNLSIIPNINNLTLNPSYNEYTYLIIKYIIDDYGKDYLLEILAEKDHFTLHGEDYLNKALTYYNNEIAIN